MADIDAISPPYVGEDRIILQLSDPQTTPLANTPFEVSVDYSPAEPNGLILPLELIIQGPNGRFKSRLFTRAFPSAVVLTPDVRGPHLVLLRECFHNKWQGRLIVDVEGEDFETTDNERTL